MQQPPPFGGSLLDAERALIDRDRLRAVAGARSAIAQPSKMATQRDAGGGGLAFAAGCAPAARSKAVDRVGGAPRGQQELGVGEQRLGIVARARSARAANAPSNRSSVALGAARARRVASCRSVG